MAPYHTSRRSARGTFFVISAYRPGPDGRLRPDLPRTGPCRQGDGRPCRIHVHHERPRKTGPCFALTVVGCKTHRRHFTIYPPGHVPYGRRTIAPVGPDGSVLADSPAKPKSVLIHSAKAFIHTYFEPALDAAEGRPWLRECPLGTSRWWGVQDRCLHRSVWWLGMAPRTSPAKRERIAQTLDVGLLLVMEQREQVREAPGFRQRGKAVASVLAAVSTGAGSVVDRLVAAGHVAGLWGLPYRWEDPPGSLRPLVPQQRYGSSRPRAP